MMKCFYTLLLLLPGFITGVAQAVPAAMPTEYCQPARFQATTKNPIPSTTSLGQPSTQVVTLSQEITQLYQDRQYFQERLAENLQLGINSNSLQQQITSIRNAIRQKHEQLQRLKNKQSYQRSYQSGLSIHQSSLNALKQQGDDSFSQTLNQLSRQAEYSEMSYDCSLGSVHASILRRGEVMVAPVINNGYKACFEDCTEAANWKLYYADYDYNDITIRFNCDSNNQCHYELKTPPFEAHLEGINEAK